MVNINLGGKELDYKDYSREQLINRIQELEVLNRELLNEKEQEVRLEYAWAGNLGSWYWNVKTNHVTFNPLKITALGYDKSEIPANVEYQFFTDKLHPEDYQKTMDAMIEHLSGKSDVYEVEYRIKTKDGKYKWYYDRGKITQYDKEGKPLFLAGIVFDITEDKETQIELEQKNWILYKMATIDALTKIGNHRTLNDHLKSAILEANKRKSPLSIAMLDIDDFKMVNDNYGHIYGDKVLEEIASIMKKNTRDSDLVGRYGGEEFMIIFTNSDGSTATIVAERIRKAIEDKIFIDGIRVTISGGVKQYQGEKLKEFIDNADKNLYKAKNNGKNQIVS